MRCGDDVLKFLISTLQATIGQDSFTDAHALEVELQIRNQYGGQEIYISKIDRDARRTAILQEFNGRNRKELCARYGICKAQFYNMLKGA